MQNFDFQDDDHNLFIQNVLGLPNSSDIEVEFDWDEALQSLEAENFDVDKKEETLKPDKTPFCIFDSLKNLHQEYKSKKPAFPYNVPAGHLLEKLVKQRKFNMVVTTLYPLHKGFTVAFSTAEGLVLQETRHSYAHDMLLDYIDREELPAPFLDHWEKTFPQVFYSGCVIMKVKDLRHSEEPNVRHVLLKPHTQSIINDVNMFFMEENLTLEDKITLESAVVNTIQSPLYLDPSPMKGGIRLLHSTFKNPLDTPTIRRSWVHSLPINISRKRRAKAVCDALKPLPVFVSNKKKKLHESMRRKSVTSTSFKEIDEFMSCKDLECKFKSVSELIQTETNRYMKEFNRKQQENDETRKNQDGGENVTSDVHKASPLDGSYEIDDAPKLIEQFIFEPDQSTAKTERAGPAYPFQAKLEISEKPVSNEFIGTLHIANKRLEYPHNTSKCSFSLGSKALACKYTEHFTEILTKEEAGKTIKITHIVPGQPSKEICTASTSTFTSTSTSTSTPQDFNPKSHTAIRIQNNGKTFMQIKPNNTLGNVQQCTFKNNPKITVQQLQPHNSSGKPLISSSVINCASEGTQFNSTTNNTIRVNKSVVSKQKLSARKVTISNSKIRTSMPGATSAQIKIPLSATGNNQRGQEQLIAITDSLHPTINVSAISQNIQSVNSSNLKGFKGSLLRNVHSVTGALENATTLQSTVGIPTVHIISSGTKEKSVTSNGQNATSSLSHSLPGLSALLADSTLTNTQILKKTSNSLEPSQ